MTQPAPVRKRSTRLSRKGGLIPETFAIFRAWDLTKSFRENLSLIEEVNPIGANSRAWLREVLFTLSSRFGEADSYRPLVIMAQRGVGLEVWKACLYWHVGAADGLYHDFATNWLFAHYESGTYRIQSSDVIPFVRQQTDGQIGGGRDLRDYGVTRAARDLLRLATQFGLLSGSSVHYFNSYHLPEEAFLYWLHAITERELSPRKVIESADWRLCLLTPDKVERELLRLHQYRKVHYESAGSLTQLQLPASSLSEYAEELAA